MNLSNPKSEPETRQLEEMKMNLILMTVYQKKILKMNLSMFKN